MIIAIIDYDIGNIKSILAAFDKVDAKTVLTRDRQTILSSDGLVLPGVGAFAHGMERLRQYDLPNTLKEFANTGKPLIGICLGMQMLFESSNEFVVTEGLGIISGYVQQLKLMNTKEAKLPHVRWSGIFRNEVITWNGTILEGLSSGEDMYFVHSYMAVPTDKGNILSTSTYSDFEFCSSVVKGNIYGCQFHPEKSAREGLEIIRNFVNICKVVEND